MSVEGEEHTLKMLLNGREEAPQKYYSSTVKHKSFQILKITNLHWSALASLRKYKIGTRMSRTSLLFSTKKRNFWKKGEDFR